MKERCQSTSPVNVAPTQTVTCPNCGATLTPKWEMWLHAGEAGKNKYEWRIECHASTGRGYCRGVAIGHTEAEAVKEWNKFAARRIKAIARATEK